MEEIKKLSICNKSASLEGISNLSNLVHCNHLETVRVLLSYPYCNFVGQVFNRTREYEAGLYFADFCYMVISENIGGISKEEFTAWDKMLITLKLNMLDCLNYWDDYICLCEYVFKNKKYTATMGQPLEPNKVFGEYLMGRDKDGNCLVDFSYVFRTRYELIKKKQHKLLNGMPIGNMLRHQKELLPFSERVYRYNVLLRTFEKFKNIK